MTLIFKDKKFSFEWFKNILFILIGTFIMSSGFVFFIDPHSIVPGGVFGVGVILNKLTEGLFNEGIFTNLNTESYTGFLGILIYKIKVVINNLFIKYNGGIPIGIVGLLLNVPLMLLGIKFLGPRFGFKTTLGFILCTVFIDVLTSWWGLVPLVEDKLLSSVFGGILIGFGLGIVFRAKATTAGTDIIGAIINKTTRLPLGQSIILVDSLIVFASLLVTPDWQIPLYSWISIYIIGRVIDITITGLQYEKALFIITEKYEEIKDKVLNDLNKTGTLIQSKGFYSGENKHMIFIVLKRREVYLIRSFIAQLDPKAFITIMNTSEILGEGFKPLYRD